jgi:competence protein ComGC
MNTYLSRKQLISMKNKKTGFGEVELISLLVIVVILILIIYPAIIKIQRAAKRTELERIQVEITDSGWQIIVTPEQAGYLLETINEKGAVEEIADFIQRKIERSVVKTPLGRVFLVSKCFIDNKFNKFKDDLREISKKKSNDAVVFMVNGKKDEIDIYAVNKNIINWKSDDIKIKDTAIGVTIILTPDQANVLLGAAFENKSEIYLNSILLKFYDLLSEEKATIRQEVSSELVKFLESNGIKFETALRQISNTNQSEEADKIFKNLSDRNFDVLITVFLHEKPKRITVDVLSSIKKIKTNQR